MRNIYSVGRFGRLGLMLLVVVCSLTAAWAQDALKPYAVYYDFGDMPSISKAAFADKGLATRTPGETRTTALVSWNTDEAVPEFKFYKEDGATKNGNMGYYVISPTTGMSKSKSQRAVGGDFVMGSVGWNRNTRFAIQTPWLNPGKYRVYLNAAYDNTNKGNKENQILDMQLDGVEQQIASSANYLFSYNAARRTAGQAKEVLVTNGSETRLDYGAFLGYIEVTAAGQHVLSFHMSNGTGECDGLMMDMLQFLPVTAADADADYIWPKFDVGGNAHFEGYNAADIVDIVGEGGSQGKKFYQVADPSVYASAAVAQFTLKANSAVTVYREDKWTRIAEFTTDENGLAVAVLPAGNYIWAYDVIEQVTPAALTKAAAMTDGAFMMTGEDQIICDPKSGDPEADFSKFEGQDQTFINNLTDEDKVYGFAGMPFSLSSGLGFASVESSNPDVVKYEDGVLKFVKAGTATVTLKSKESDFFQSVEESVVITVAKAGVTISVGDYDKQLYADMPEFVLTADGLKFDDSIEDLGVQIACAAVKESTRGDYPITLSAEPSDCYDITLVNGTLTIGRLEQTLTFDQELAGTYGDTIDLAATSDAGLAVSFASDDASVVKIEGIQAILVGAGSTNIIAYQLGNEDYLPAAEISLPVTVAKRTLTVTADANLGLKGGPAPVFGYTYEGFIYGDDETALSVNPEFVTDAVTNGVVTGDVTTFDATYTPQNDYEIYMVPTTGVADNYTIVPVSARFVVIPEKMNQTIEFAPVQPIFGQPVELSAEAFSAGRKSTYVKTNIPVKFLASDASKELLKVEGNTVTALGYGDELSILAVVPGNDVYFPDTVEQFVTVSRIPITITANDAERMVFHPEPEFSYTISGEFLEGDNEQTIRDLLADATITTKARFRSKAGRYEINVNGIEGTESYEFIYVPGYITVTKAPTEIIGFGGTTLTVMYGNRVDITAKVVSPFIASTGEYGEVQIPYMTSADSTIADICDPLANENISYIIGNGVGTTNVYAYFPGNEYYEAADTVLATHEVIVVKREITLIANDASRYASQPNPEFTYSAIGLASTYKIDILDTLFSKPGAVAPVLVTDATPSSLRGDKYEINFDLTNPPVLPNYDIVGYKAGHLTITGGVQQSIQFGAENITRIETGNPKEFKYKLSATATSGLTVTYSLLNPSIDCAELNGNILTFKTDEKLVNLTIVAHQVGNNYYGAADDVSQQFGLVQFHGTVTDSSTYEPIVNATVRIYREKNIERTPEQIAEDNRTGRTTYPVSNIYELVDEVKTNGDGFYNSTFVQGLSRFKIEVIAGEGYMNLYYDFRSGGRGTTYTWENSNTTSDAPVISGSSYLRNFEIPPQPVMKGAASVEGKVFIDKCADFVNTVEDVTVYLLQAVNPKSATPRFNTFLVSQIPVPEQSVTGWKSSGTFKFNNIPWGKYFLGITYPGGNTSNMSAGFIFAVDSASLDTTFRTRDFLIVDRDAYTQTITAADDDIAASLVDVTVYPNPTSNGIFRIATEEGEYTLTIVNEAQQTVYATKVASADFEVNLSGKPDGLYFVIIDFGDKQIVKKVTLLK